MLENEKQQQAGPQKVIFNGQLPHARHRVHNERDRNALTQDFYI